MNMQSADWEIEKKINERGKILFFSRILAATNKKEEMNS